VPTPEPITCPTPGTYTFTATTVTLEETTTVCVPGSTHVPSGTHVVGGVTTVVDTATTVTCPVGVVTTLPDGIVKSTIISTEYVCPTAGTYTIAPITVTVTEECDVDFPVPTSYNPGTYTAPEQVVTVTDTDYVTVCPYTSSEKPAPPKSTQAPPPPPPAPKPKPAPKPAPEPEPKPEPKPQPPKEEKPSNPGHFDGSFGSDGDHFGITYTAYDEQTGACKSASQVDKDIAEIKKDDFNVVRVYSTDCNTLESVGNACKKHGVQMIVGVFVKSSGCSVNTPEIKEQIDALSSWNHWDIAKLLVVGNEAVMNNYCSPSELQQLIKAVKGACSAYTGPVTVAETLDIWLRPDFKGAICDEVDFTGANIHPFFNPENLADLAGTFVKGQLTILDNICPGKQAVNLECGWPTGGRCLGSACPGEDAQAKALSSIRKAVGGRTVFFSWANDAWKEPGELGCEQFWGTKQYFQNNL
jgi:exo-beta-1,3-glucanase (GH17 family)